MCSRYTYTKDEAKLRLRDLIVVFGAVPRANIRPTDLGPVILPEHDGFACRELHWGWGVRIGRALNREAQMIGAMKNAEADKSLFCLVNDNIGAALLACLASGDTFTGTAGELREKIIATDGDLADKLSVKRLGKRLSALWPHLKKQLATARQEKDRNHFTIYTLKARPAEYAEFQMPFP